MKNIRLGDLLIELGYITPDQLTAALAYQKEHRDLRVGQALQELGYVNERQVLEALAKRLQIQLIDIEHTTVDVTAVEKVPQELAQKYDMLPIAQSARALTVAANDPLNYYAIEDIRQLTGMEPEIVLAELEPLRRVCPHCARQMPVTEEERAYLGSAIPFVRRGTGWTQCNGTGYRGRVAIHELVIINRELREMISAGATQEELTAAARRNQGMTSLREAALQLVREGETTPEELLKITFYEE